LEGGHEPVTTEGEDPGADEDQAAVFADALPDQPGAADLGQRGQDEQQHGAQHGMPVTMAGTRVDGVVGTPEGSCCVVGRAG
jgi:hypothetical protein